LLRLCLILVDSVQPPSRRTPRLFPRSFDDFVPADEDLNHSDSSGNALSTLPDNQNPPQRRIQRVLLTLRDTLQTAFTAVGLCRSYPRRPSFEPDKFIPSSQLAATCPTVVDTHDAQAHEPSLGVSGPPFPFVNMSIYRLMTWMNSGSHQKSETEVTRLVKDVMQAEDFNLGDFDGFSVRKSLRMLDNHGGKGAVKFPDDWLETDLTIEIPTRLKEDSSTSFRILGFHYHPLVAVIRSAFADVQASAYHLFPFRRIWKDPLDGHQERVFDELYTSDSWLDAQDDLQRQPREPGCSLERVIAGLMFFSDATHLATFGTAKAWPLYLYFGNLTKYARSAPKSGACHLVGFLPSVSKLSLILFFALTSFSASRPRQRCLQQLTSNIEKRHGSASCALSARLISCMLETSLGRGICSSLSSWNCTSVPRRSIQKGISAHFHLLG
jgi:hypothetical protein